jgi:4-hydroxy-tetrahydrodipicolinate synthase
MTSKAKRPYRGVFPVAPTIFDANGNLDLDGQRRCIDFMIDAGSQGICILANFSEQFVLTDAERETVMHTVLKHVAGRVPVIVTTTHFSSAICAARSRQAEEAGADMVMVMPPYHGATFRVGEPAIFEFFRVVSDAVKQACKVLMREGGVIKSDTVRHPLQSLHPATRAGLIEIARSLDPVVLRWGR